MAHSKSSKKRIFIGERNANRNQAIKSRVKTFVKKVLSAVEAKNVDEAKTALQVAYKELDKAVTKGVLKKNTASRKKSRLALKVGVEGLYPTRAQRVETPNTTYTTPIRTHH